MGWFDRKARKPQPAPPPPAARKGAPRGEGPTVQVPEGHRVDIHRPGLSPRLVRTAGNVLIADTGFGGDERPEVWGDVLREVENAVDGAGQVNLSDHQGSIQGLFAPADPRVVPVLGAVLWILHTASLGDWIDDPARLQELLRRIHRLGARRDPPIYQVASLVDRGSPAARLVGELLSGLGIPLRTPEKDGSVLVEVHRPEGVVLSALTGPPQAAQGSPPDPYPRTVNEEKDRAESEHDRARLRQIEERELAFLAKRVTEVLGDRRREPLARAPRLGRLLLDVATTGSEAAWAALNEELLSRDFPLILMADPKTKGIAPRAWPGLGKALPAYPDLVSLEWTAADLKMASSSFAVAAMPPRTLLEWAAKIGVAIAINVYRDRSSPLYVMLPVDRVEALVHERAQRKG